MESGGAEWLKRADGAKGLVLTYVADIRGQAIWLINLYLTPLSAEPAAGHCGKNRKA